MAFEEKRAWVMLVTSVLGYLVYLGLLLGRGGSLVGGPYVGALLWTVGGAIVVNIVIGIGLGIASPRERGLKDERDREIWRFGENIGQSFLVIGGVSALVMAMAEVGYFWIANSVYLCFVLSAALGALAKVIAYRRGFQSW